LGVTGLPSARVVVPPGYAAGGRAVWPTNDDDRTVIGKAVMAPDGLGAASVVGPLAADLPRASSPRRRLATLGVLIAFGREERAAVTRALTDAVGREPDPHVRAAAQAALTSLILSGMAPTA